MHRFEELQKVWDIRTDVYAKMNLPAILRMVGYWSSADEEISAEGIITGQGHPVVALNFDRRYVRLQKHCFESPSVERWSVRTCAHSVEEAMDLAVQWIETHPEYTVEEPSLEKYTWEYVKSLRSNSDE